VGTNFHTFAGANSETIMSANENDDALLKEASVTHMVMVPKEKNGHDRNQDEVSEYEDEEGEDDKEGEQKDVDEVFVRTSSPKPFVQSQTLSINDDEEEVDAADIALAVLERKNEEVLHAAICKALAVL